MDSYNSNMLYLYRAFNNTHCFYTENVIFLGCLIMKIIKSSKIKKKKSLFPLSALHPRQLQEQSFS